MSAAVGMLFFLFVFYTKELHVHPMRIIMYIAFFESIYLFLGVEQFYICDFGFHKLLSWTVFYSNDPFDVVRSIYILLYSTNFIAVFSAEMTVMLNIMLCIDLVLMVRYPFEKKESRIPWYLMISLILSIPSAITLVLQADSNMAMTIGSYLAFTYKTTFILIFICSVIYICRKLSGPGFSKEVRNLVLKRHIMTTVLWLITNTYTFINVSFILTRDMKDIMMYKGNDSWWACTLKIMFAT